MVETRPFGAVGFWFIFWEVTLPNQGKQGCALCAALCVETLRNITVPSNYFHTRERLGALGGIVQHHTALYRSVAVHEPTVLIVRRGCKKLRWVGRELRIAAGEAVALAGGQMFDVINIPDSDGLYQAQWIAFEQEAIERFAAQYGTVQAVCDAVKLPHPGRMNAAFDYAAAVLADEEVPHNAAEAALCGVLAWLQHDGIGFAVYGGGNLMRQIRKLITADMAADWSSAMLARRLNCSEAALRRRTSAGMSATTQCIQPSPVGDVGAAA